MTDLDREILETIRMLTPEQKKFALLSAYLSAMATKHAKQQGGIPNE